MKYQKGGCKEDGTRLFSGAQEAMGKIEAQEVHSEHQETLFYCEGD